ncbi:hypothetical protein G5C51_41015 [Streptomyces sp. A7024]|uniref:Membrane-associated oxidoreductase n=1 Tax=Streptomyces coryli TaxID=1128680 RepID=A0A6G4UF05_9ACTN|nr:hypothetical protein [Streptomyces coryli]NGN70251.1 hypothetical protein [Streptomyces coryli]
MQPHGITPPEQQVWDAFTSAREVDLGTGDREADDPAQGADWGPERTIRAEVITALLLGAREPEPGRAAAVSLVGARITGSLELDHTEFDHHLRLIGCWFEQRVNLYGTRTRQLSFNGSHLPGLLASHAAIDGNLRLKRCRSTAEIRLVGTHVTGAVILEQAHLSDAAGEALTADRLHVDNDLLLRDLAVDGVFRLRSAVIGGGAHLRQCRLNGHDGVALDAHRLQVEGDFSAYRLHAGGALGLRGAAITGSLFLRAAQLTNPAGRTLDAIGAQIGSDVVLDEGFTANGRIRLRNTRVGGSVQLDDARVTGSEDVAVDAVRAQVDVDFRANQLHAEGELDLYGITVNGSLQLRTAHLTNPAGRTLDARASRIGADVQLDKDFTADGPITLATAEVGGGIYLRTARLTGPPVTDHSALSLRHVRAREVDLRTVNAAAGRLSLRHATIGVLRDAPESWPESITMDGVAYDQLEQPLTAAERLPWLQRDERGSYHPQPYEQLAATYRRLGHEDDARVILLAKQRARRAQLPRYARAWGLAQDVTVGYGYHPARALGWLLGLLAVGFTVFSIWPPRVLEEDKAPPLNELFYTLDLLLPVINFGQESAYAAHGGGQWLAYILTAAGWILATTVAAGMARALNRQ